MLEILTGKLSDISEKQTKNGKAIIVDITKMAWDKGVKSYVPADTISVWYCNDATARAQHVLNKRADYLNKTVILMANKEEVKGKTSYYGRLAPTTYGLLRVPVQLNPEADSDDFMNADLGISDCQDAGLIDSFFTLDLEEKNTSILADHIWSAISVLSAARKNAGSTYDADTLNMLNETIMHLNKLVIAPTAAYIGMLLGYTVYDSDEYPNINLSVTIPNNRSAGSAAPTQWCNCKVFRPKDDSNNTSAYARLKNHLKQKVIQKKDRVVLYLSGEQTRNGQPSFTCYSYQRL